MVPSHPHFSSFLALTLSDVKPSGGNERVLRAYAAELKAEQAYSNGDYATATELLQKLMDEKQLDRQDRGWYLQEMARYQYRANRLESERLQIAAHKDNRLSLRPHEGVTVAKLTIVSQGRIERIIDWVRAFENYGHPTHKVASAASFTHIVCRCNHY